MDVMEKLVELLGGCPCESDCEGMVGSCYNRRHGYCNEIFKLSYCSVSKLAQHLITHGVTVQEWIPASEPPKKYRDEYGELIPFLVCEEDTDYPFRAMYDGKTWGDGIFAIPVKWWMHLPAPPKEKERKDGDGNV